jgi:hypothetical protein
VSTRAYEELARFAVVGRVNKGKSSIVSTFTESDGVRVDSLSGSTRVCQEFRWHVRGRTLYTMIDTPGFGSAGAVLEWLTERETSAADRPRLVERFVETFSSGKQFPEECELLPPILAGASIIYVVDGSNPYRPNYEAEMEILRWTGRPRMALINRKGSDDNEAEWRRALGQYFSIVRVFDAHSSGIDERLALLRAFRELDPSAEAAMDRAIATVEQDWLERRSLSARAIADLLVDTLTMRMERPAGDHDYHGDYKTKESVWIEEFRAVMRERERRERRDVELLYHHDALERVESELAEDAITTDLFSRKTWRVLGLDQWQLARVGVVGGAAVGGTLDAITGGTSFLTGTVIGGMVGGLSSYFGVPNAARVEIVGRPLGQRVAIVGPVTDTNFPWLVLDRAVLHHAAVSGRAHAVRNTLVLGEGNGNVRVGPSGAMDASERGALGSIFNRIRRAGAADAEALSALALRVEAILERLAV